MNYQPSFEEASQYAESYRSVPISTTLYSDICTPIALLRILKNVSRHCYMLESLEDSTNWGRYTFLGYDPKLELSCINGTLHIKSGTDITIKTDNPGQYIKQIISEEQRKKMRI